MLEDPASTVSGTEAEKWMGVAFDEGRNPFNEDGSEEAKPMNRLEWIFCVTPSARSR